MHAVRALGAITAIAIGAAAEADDTRVPINVGTFGNIGGGHIYYSGAFGSYIHSKLAAGKDGTDHTLIEIDLAGIVTSQDLAGFYGVSIIDAGYNMYGARSPGADVDLLALDSISPNTDVTFVYEGPNPVHQDESESLLARRVRYLDSFMGAQDVWHDKHVSLGKLGRLEALLSEPMPLVDLPPDERPMLLLSEAGSTEFFRVRILAAIPAPGSFALLAVAAVVAGRPRRRR
jgi:hypothetical protein